MCKGMAERELLMPSSGLPEACALLERHGSIRVPAAGRALVGSGGRRGCRCGLRASGPPLDTCRPPCWWGGDSTAGSLGQSRWRGARAGEGSGADLSRLWEPQALFWNFGFHLGLSCGEAGSWVPSYDCLKGRGVIRWNVGLQMQEPLV